MQGPATPVVAQTAADADGIPDTSEVLPGADPMMADAGPVAL